MKNKLLQFITIVLLLITAFAACKKVPVSGVTLEPSSALITIEQTITLTASIIPSDAYNKNVSWESSDTNIATVDNGKVTGIAAGKAIIIVTTEDGKRFAKCHVTVIQPIEPEMIWVEGGIFTMGCTDDECSERELPAHQVTLNSFYISKYITTREEWASVMGAFEGSEYSDYPVHSISFEQIQDFISKLNAATGKNYRLPTEAEWEYAARGGNKSQGFKYSGSNNIDEVAWYGDNGGMAFFQPVGKKQPNELGIYDMSGNMFEFCSDWLGAYTSEPQDNPQGIYSGDYHHILRGGSVFVTPQYARVSHRHVSKYPSSIQFSFRLVHP